MWSKSAFFQVSHFSQDFNAKMKQNIIFFGAYSQTLVDTNMLVKHPRKLVKTQKWCVCVVKIKRGDKPGKIKGHSGFDLHFYCLVITLLEGFGFIPKTC